MIRVLIAEDSLTARELLANALSAHPELAVIGFAATGEQALAQVELLRPDVVTMDIRMPMMDGLEATRRIMERCPTPIVIVSGTVNPRDRRVSVEALHVGAVALLPKLPSPWQEGYAAAASELAGTVAAMASVKLVRRWPRAGRIDPAPSAHTALAHGRTAPLVAVVASTGGPSAVRQVLEGLESPVQVPLLLVQHMSSGFHESYVEWLAKTTSHAVRLAEHGEALRPGVLVAPEGRQLTVDRERRVALTDHDAPSGFRPSGDALLASVGEAYGRRALGVVLTGMGQDGLAGAEVLARCGGHLIAQSEESCVVYGMPAAVTAAGLTHEVLPLDRIAARLREVGA